MMFPNNGCNENVNERGAGSASERHSRHNGKDSSQQLSQMFPQQGNVAEANACFYQPGLSSSDIGFSGSMNADTLMPTFSSSLGISCSMGSLESGSQLLAYSTQANHANSPSAAHLHHAIIQEEQLRGSTNAQEPRQNLAFSYQDMQPNPLNLASIQNFDGQESGGQVIMATADASGQLSSTHLFEGVVNSTGNAQINLPITSAGPIGQSGSQPSNSPSFPMTSSTGNEANMGAMASVGSFQNVLLGADEVDLQNVFNNSWQQQMLQQAPQVQQHMAMLSQRNSQNTFLEQVPSDFPLVPQAPQLPLQVPPEVKWKGRGRSSTFPLKLHQMLLDLEQVPGGTDIAAFLPHGKGFQIKKPREFSRDVLPHYFRMSTYSSFQRQLNLYDFQRIAEGSEKGAYWHELFLRDQPMLSSNMKRNKEKGITRAKQNLRLKNYENQKKDFDKAEGGI